MNILIISSIVVVILIIVIFIYYYKKSITCNKNNCDNLVTISNWELDSETANSATLVKKCTNKSSVNGCTQLDSSNLTKIVNWSDISCNKACGADSKGYKTLTFDNTRITSKNTYPCNIEPCDSLVNFGEWTLKSETTDNAIITKTCTNKYNNRDACSLIPNSDLNKSIPWTDLSNCSKICGTGSNKKTTVIDNTTITSNNTYPCNTEPCNSLVNFGEWSKVSETNDNVTIKRTCINKYNTRDACSLIPTTDLNKTINWSGFDSCSNTKKFKFINIDNTTFKSNTSYPCLNIIQPSDFKISLSAYSLQLNNNDKITSWSNFIQTNDIYKPTYINDNNIIYVKFTGDTTNRTFLSYVPLDKNVNYGNGNGATFIVLARYNNKTQYNRIIAHIGNNNTVTRNFEWTDTHALFYYNNSSEISLPNDYINLNKICLYVIRFTNNNKTVELFRNNILLKSIINYQGLVNGITDTYFIGCQGTTSNGNNTDLIYTSIYERPLTNNELTDLYNSVKSICQD